MLEKLKNKLWIVIIPVAIIVLLSISAIKDIEKSHIELDNGKFLLDTPLYVIKDFNNQTPLSYHIINKSYLKDKFYNNIDYQIL